MPYNNYMPLNRLLNSPMPFSGNPYQAGPPVQEEVLRPDIPSQYHRTCMWISTDSEDMLRFRCQKPAFHLQVAHVSKTV